MPSTEPIFSRLRAIIHADLMGDPSRITHSASFRDDLGADSLESIGLVVAMEREVHTREGEAMKPQTISTLEGMFTLDRDGFYIPYEEPEPKISGAWMYVLAAVVASLVVGAVWMAARAVIG